MAAPALDKSLPSTPSRELARGIVPAQKEGYHETREKPESPPLSATTPSSIGLDLASTFPDCAGPQAGMNDTKSRASLIPTQENLQRALSSVLRYLPTQVSTIAQMPVQDIHSPDEKDAVDGRQLHPLKYHTDTATGVGRAPEWPLSTDAQANPRAGPGPEIDAASSRAPPPYISRRTHSGLSTAANDGFTPSRSPASSAAGTPDIDKATVILAFPGVIERRFTDLYASDRATDGHGTSSGKATTSGHTTSGGHTATSAGHTTSTHGVTDTSHNADDGHSAPSDRPVKKSTASTWLSSRDRVDSPLASSMYADAGHSTPSGFGYGARTSSMVGVLSRSGSGILSSGYLDSPAQGTSVEANAGHDALSSAGHDWGRASDAQSSMPMSTAADAGHSVYAVDAHDDAPRDDASWRTLAGSPAYGIAGSLDEDEEKAVHQECPMKHHHECPVKQHIQSRQHKEEAIPPKVKITDKIRGEAKIIAGKLARKEERVEEGRRIMGRA